MLWNAPSVLSERVGSLASTLSVPATYSEKRRSSMLSPSCVRLLIPMRSRCWLMVRPTQRNPDIPDPKSGIVSASDEDTVAPPTYFHLFRMLRVPSTLASHHTQM